MVRVFVCGDLRENAKKAAGVAPAAWCGVLSCYEDVTWDRRGRGLWKVAGAVHGIDHEPVPMRLPMKWCEATGASTARASATAAVP